MCQGLLKMLIPSAPKFCFLLQVFPEESVPLPSTNRDNSDIIGKKNVRLPQIHFYLHSTTAAIPIQSFPDALPRLDKIFLRLLEVQVYLLSTRGQRDKGTGQCWSTARCLSTGTRSAPVFPFPRQRQESTAWAGFHSTAEEQSEELKAKPPPLLSAL